MLKDNQFQERYHRKIFTLCVLEYCDVNVKHRLLIGVEISGLYQNTVC